MRFRQAVELVSFSVSVVACQGYIQSGDESTAEPVSGAQTGGGSGTGFTAGGSSSLAGGTGGDSSFAGAGAGGSSPTCTTSCGPGSTCLNGVCVCQSGLLECAGACTDTSSDSRNCGGCGNVCGAAQTCQNGVCTCSGGLAGCAAGCTDVQSDNANCGACGSECGSGQTCAAASCQCVQGLSPCSGACVNLDGDPANCGACGNQCPTGQVCSGGQCQANCQAGETLCSLQSCADLTSDVANCGACGNQCPAGQICQNGGCRCTGSLTECNGACVDTAVSSTNCGTCGNACPSGRTCSGGSCVCISGQLCGSQCVNTGTDLNNCGSCGNVCTGGRLCSNGTCNCPSGQTLCNGTCVNTQTNASHCGSCGTTCSGGSCSNGMCTCPSGQTSCSNQCKNLQTDAQNCGQCGRQCSTGQTCSGGNCTGGNTGKAFSQCRFHFGALDGVARQNATIRAQLDFFTPGWMGIADTFDQQYVCDWGNPGGTLANQVPVIVAYVAAFYVKRHHGPLCDCNVTTCGSTGGRPNDLCNFGAQYIRQDIASIVNVYRSYAQGYASCYGTTRPLIFEIEPDWYQYVDADGNPNNSHTQTAPLTLAESANYIGQFVAAMKQYLPNAFFSMDISPWVYPNNGQDNGAQWYSHLNMANFTFINTSGGGTLANNTKIRPSNNMTWAGVSNATGKPILADTGYGAAGQSAGHDAAWDVVGNINARINDGVISISQYNPNSNWGTTISNIRSQLSAPKFCP